MYITLFTKFSILANTPVNQDKVRCVIHYVFVAERDIPTQLQVGIMERIFLQWRSDESLLLQKLILVPKPIVKQLQSPNQKIPDRKTKCVIKTHINIKQNVIFSAKLKPV